MNAICTSAVNVYAAATTSLMAATLSVLRSCFAVVILYGLCYIGIKVMQQHVYCDEFISII